MAGFKHLKYNRGSILIYLMIFITVFSVIMIPVVQNFMAKLRLLSTTIIREQAFQIAEAGVNYYQWHLAQVSTDYQDGTGHAGPYLHNYLDYSTQQLIGQFSLEITPPSPGGNTVIVKSTGWTTENPNIKRILTATFNFPSFANYALISNDWIYNWNTESYNGPVHSNTGIRFEGTINTDQASVQQPSVATSLSKTSTYTCDASQGYPDTTCPAIKSPIWATGINQQQSSSYWKYSTTTANFNAINSSFTTIANLIGIVNFPASGKYGYSLVFNSNGSVSIYKVLSTTNSGSEYPITQPLINGEDTGLASFKGGTSNAGGTDYGGKSQDICYNSNCNGCSNYNRCFQQTVTIPSNGLIIYAKENLWVEGTVKGKVTVATYNSSGTILNPNSNGVTADIPNIYIPNNIRYFDAVQGPNGDTAPINNPNADTIGLMAQGNIVVTKNAPNNTYIDAALLAQRGFIAFPICYSGSNRVKTNLYIFGSMILNGSWWFNFSNYCGYSYLTDGYSNPHFTWDSNLLYYPPPYFPASTINASLKLVNWTSD